jgi:hypothetical protein
MPVVCTWGGPVFVASEQGLVYIPKLYCQQCGKDCCPRPVLCTWAGPVTVPSEQCVAYKKSFNASSVVKIGAPGLCCVPGVGLSLSRLSRVASLSSLPILSTSSSSSPPPSRIHAFLARHMETTHG